MFSLFEKFSVSQETIFFIFLTLLSYVFYFFISRSKKIKYRFSRRLGKEKIKTYWVIFQRGIGVLLYGIIPACVVFIILSRNHYDYGLSLVNFTESLYWTLGLSAVIIPFSILSARCASHQKKYRPIQTIEWKAGLVILSACSWMVYLFAYELLLRGILFFSCLNSFGLWPAVIINISIYAFFHLHKDYKEVIGSVPLGIAFCFITFETGTIWAAFFAHTILALSHEWSLIYFNPKMKIKLSGNRG